MTPTELEHRLTELEQAVKPIPELIKELHEIVTKFNRYEARWGTLIMVGTALWALFVTFKDSLFALFRGHP